MKARVEITATDIVFASELAKVIFLEHNKGKPAYLVIDDQPTTNMRRYFEGAVVPAVFYQQGGWADFSECREALKLEFLPTWARILSGERLKIAKSTTSLSKAQFRAFLDQVVYWMIDNAMDIPNPDEYKAWRDSGPAAGEMFPQLRRLLEQYNKNIFAQHINTLKRQGRL